MPIRRCRTAQRLRRWKYLKGVYDSADFKEEDHPRGGAGSGKGGQFVTSEKTKQKEDKVDSLKSGKAPNGDSEIKESVKKALGVDCKVTHYEGGLSVSYRPSPEDWKKMKNHEMFSGSGLLANALDKYMTKNHYSISNMSDRGGVSTLYIHKRPKEW